MFNERPETGDTAGVTVTSGYIFIVRECAPVSRDRFDSNLMAVASHWCMSRSRIDARESARVRTRARTSSILPTGRFHHGQEIVTIEWDFSKFETVHRYTCPLLSSNPKETTSFCFCFFFFYNEQCAKKKRKFKFRFKFRAPDPRIPPLNFVIRRIGERQDASILNKTVTIIIARTR